MMQEKYFKDGKKTTKILIFALAINSKKWKNIFRFEGRL